MGSGWLTCPTANGCSRAFEILAGPTSRGLHCAGDYQRSAFEVRIVSATGRRFPSDQSHGAQMRWRMRACNSPPGRGTRSISAVDTMRLRPMSVAGIMQARTLRDSLRIWWFRFSGRPTSLPGFADGQWNGGARDISGAFSIYAQFTPSSALRFVAGKLSVDVLVKTATLAPIRFA